MTVKRTVSVIIPVYRPDNRLTELVRRLALQALVPDRLVIVNTVSDEGGDILREARMEAGRCFRESSFLEVSKEDFDHGGTRNLAAGTCGTDLLMFMTMDALPADRSLTERLAACFDDESCACAYARQLPTKDATPEERYGRERSYPTQSRRKTAADLAELGIRTYFCSDVCAMYRRETFEAMGGFASPVIFNEDMIFAAGAVKAGMSVHYCAEAKVIHSHDYNGAAQFHRNFDLGVSQADHPEVFSGISSEKEGGKLVAGTAAYLAGQGKPWRVPLFIWRCACRYAGYLLGRHYRALPRRVVLACTSNRDYWGKIKGGKSEKLKAKSGK